jgi:PIN domain nuclease of toxin-antitoxin system
MTTFLLDTHVILWAFGERTKLSKRVTDLILDQESDLVVSSVSLWEIVLKVHAGKLDLPATPEFFDTQMAKIGVSRVLSIGPVHIYATFKLPPVHKDPFDRLLAAQCVVERMHLVTADRIFQKYPIEVVW